MSNYEEFRDILKQYFADKGIDFPIETTLHDSSKNDHDKNTVPTYLYAGEKNLSVISMDAVAQIGYKKLKGAPDGSKHNVNTADAFLIDANKEWYFIEFKDCKISSKKENIEKKGMANWLMLMDILGDMDVDTCSKIVDTNNFMQFARNHITYIVVCNGDKDLNTYEQVRNSNLTGEHYTPECLYKFKDFFFKDAYAYTEHFFENKFVKKFAFE